MPASTRCPLCSNTGFVRFEVVIKGGHVQREFYCGRCNGTWVVDISEPVSHDRQKREPAGN